MLRRFSHRYTPRRAGLGHRLDTTRLRLSPVNPNVPLYDLELWLAVDNLKGLADGDEILRMDSFTPHGNPKVYTGSGWRYVANGQNGLPVMRDNNGVGILNPAWVPTGWNWFSDFKAGDLFVVLKCQADPPASGYRVTPHGWIASDWCTAYPYTDGTIYDGFMSSARKTVGNIADNLAAWHVYNCCSEDGRWEYFYNGTSKFSTATNTFAAAGSGALGHDGMGWGSTWDGYMAEVLLYRRVLSDRERAKLTAYLRAKWGI